MSTERALQVWFKARCKAAGVYCRKFASPAHRGVPDLVLAYSGRVVFVELKTPTGRGVLSALQRREVDILRNHGVDVYIVSSREQGEQVLEELTDAQSFTTR